MTAALFSNPNWDDEKNDRGAKLRELNEHFNGAIEAIYNPKPKKQIDWSNPFYAAAKRGLEKTRQKYAWAIEEKVMEDVIDPKRLEQLRAREESRKAIDQI